MDILINIAPFREFFAAGLDIIFIRLLTYYGWIILGILYLFGCRRVWLMKRYYEYSKKIKYKLLAVDVPRGNMQSPKAVENLFTYLGGAHGTIGFFEKWWEGKYQVAFSFEVVSIDGYTQFLIRTPVEYQYLLETAIYSQYPDAEIVEVDDYVDNVPHRFPNDEYDIMGGEFIQVADQCFPIITYEQFEHKMGEEETTFRDPMSSLMDMCSSLQRGEQFWYQIIVIPTGFEWVKACDKPADKIMGAKTKGGFGNKLADNVLLSIANAGEVLYKLWDDVSMTSGTEALPKKMMDLRPVEKLKMEALQLKSSRLGFLAKVRVLYIAKKEVFNPKKASNGFVGYIKQFTDNNLNSFKPDLDFTFTSTGYFGKIERTINRKNRLIANYCGRSDSHGRDPKILNVTELATIWHFPVEGSVKAPLIQKTPVKRSKPPLSLPAEEVLERQQENLEPVYSWEDIKGKELAETKRVELQVEKEELAETKKVEQKVEPVEKTGEAPENLPFG